MAEDDEESRESSSRAPDGRGRTRAVPTTRVGRFAKVARLAGGVAGGMLAEGAR